MYFYYIIPNSNILHVHVTSNIKDSTFAFTHFLVLGFKVFYLLVVMVSCIFIARHDITLTIINFMNHGSGCRCFIKQNYMFLCITNIF